MESLAQSIQAHLERTLYNPYSMSGLAKQFGMSTTSLNAHFKAAYGVTIPVYVRTRRMEQAAVLLAEEELPITRIAIKVGYANPSKFSQAFKKAFGVSPSEYRRRAFVDRAKRGR